MAFNLGKPPVVECWIEFETEIEDAGARWNPDATKAFLNALSGDFRAKRLRWATEVDLDPDDEIPTLSQYCDRVEAVSESQNRVVQVGQSVLIYSALRDEKPWPAFSEICDQAMEALQAYRDRINPGSLNRVTLHYRDIVNLPCPKADEGVEIEDYLNVYAKIPEMIPARQLAYYSIELYFDPSGTRDGIYLETRPLAYDIECKTLPIELLWHSVSKIDDPVTDQGVAESLGVADDSLSLAFRACFTDLGWSLFEPK